MFLLDLYSLNFHYNNILLKKDECKILNFKHFYNSFNLYNTCLQVFA